VRNLVLSVRIPRSIRGGSPNSLIAASKGIIVPTPAPQMDRPRRWFDESSPLANDDSEVPPDADAKSGQAFQESNLCVHLMTVSAGMVGVCLTVIGLFRLIQNFQGAGTIANDLVAIDSLLFVTVCIFSYGAMRTASRKKRKRLERIADVLFLSALSFMAVICGIIAWTIA
jgi:hypothetical protein